MNQLIDEFYGNCKDNSEFQQDQLQQIRLFTKYIYDKNNNEIVIQNSCSDRLPFNQFAQYVFNCIHYVPIEHYYFYFLFDKHLICKSETKTLKELGIRDGDTIYLKFKLELHNTEGMIFLVIQCSHDIDKLEFIMNCHPNTAFTDLVPLLKEAVVAHKIKYYEGNIEYTIGGKMISADETMTLDQLGANDIRLIKMKINTRVQNS